MKLGKIGVTQSERKFNGKTFRYVETERTRKNAQRRATELKRNFVDQTRIVKKHYKSTGQTFYDIYVRKKRGISQQFIFPLR